MASTVVMIIVFLLDFIAFGLAVAAEQRRSTAHIFTDSYKVYNYCVYDSDRSIGYGVGSYLFLLASQLLITVVSKCFCCGNALCPGSSRAWAIILLIFSWVTFFIAEICLLAGSVRNAYHTEYMTFFGDEPPSCQTVRKGVFAAGAAFVFITGILTELYYVCYSNAKESLSSSREESEEMMINYK